MKLILLVRKVTQLFYSYTQTNTTLLLRLYTNKQHPQLLFTKTLYAEAAKNCSLYSESRFTLFARLEVVQSIVFILNRNQKYILEYQNNSFSVGLLGKK